MMTMAASVAGLAHQTAQDAVRAHDVVGAIAVRSREGGAVGVDDDERRLVLSELGAQLLDCRFSLKV